MTRSWASPSATCYGLYFHAAIWVAAGVQRPVNFKDASLCLLQTRAGDSLKVKRPHPFSNASLLAKELMSSSKSSEPPQAVKRMPSSMLESRVAPAPLSYSKEHQLSFDALSVFDDETSGQTHHKADFKSTEHVLEAFRKSHQNSYDGLPLFDGASFQSTRNAERSMFIMHVILTTMVVLGVFIIAIVSTCNARTAKAGDAHAILEHITKAGVPPEPPYGSTATATEPFAPLCAMPDMPPGGASYLIPDLAQMKHGIVSFDILGSDGEAILEGVINNEAKDAGILLQQPKGVDEGGGAPVAFVSTARAALAFGNIPIVRPRVGRPQGEHFGILKRIADGKYSVARKRCTVMVIEGHVAERCLKLHTALPQSSEGHHNTIGSTRPCSDANGQARIELHVGTGVDAGLAIMCLLTIIRLEASCAAPK